MSTTCSTKPFLSNENESSKFTKILSKFDIRDAIKEIYEILEDKINLKSINLEILIATPRSREECRNDTLQPTSSWTGSKPDLPKLRKTSRRMASTEKLTKWRNEEKPTGRAKSD